MSTVMLIQYLCKIKVHLKTFPSADKAKKKKKQPLGWQRGFSQGYMAWTNHKAWVCKRKKSITKCMAQRESYLKKRKGKKSSQEINSSPIHHTCTTSAHHCQVRSYSRGKVQGLRLTSLRHLLMN